MIVEIARRAKLLNQFAHLQLLQRCAASCRRGRASVGIIADAPKRSEVPTLPTAYRCCSGRYLSASCQHKARFPSPLSNYSRFLARSLRTPHTDHDRPDNKQPTAQDTSPPAPTNKGFHTSRCGAYSDQQRCK